MDTSASAVFRVAVRMMMRDNDMEQSPDAKYIDRDLLYTNPASNGELKIEVAEGISEIKMIDLGGREIRALPLNGQRTVNFPLNVHSGFISSTLLKAIKNASHTA